MDVEIRPMRKEDVATADRVFRQAFGTFLGMPDPLQFMGDAILIKTRFNADPSAAFVATHNGEVVGSNIATNWGSVGFFGPLTIRPDLWDKGISHKLMAPIVQKFAQWNNKHLGLFTFAQSPKHIALYQKYDFWPRSLTAIMARPVQGGTAPRGTVAWTLSAVPQNEREILKTPTRAATRVLRALERQRRAAS